MQQDICDKNRWAFVNVNLRPYYAEGAKTPWLEIAKQLGWKLPQHVIVASAGRTLLPRVAKSFAEIARVGLIENSACKLCSAQASGCAPIVNALHQGRDIVTPAKPNTIATSIVISITGNGFKSLDAVAGSVGKPHGIAAKLKQFDQLFRALKLGSAPRPGVNDRRR